MAAAAAAAAGAGGTAKGLRDGKDGLTAAAEEEEAALARCLVGRAVGRSKVAVENEACSRSPPPAFQAAVLLVLVLMLAVLQLPVLLVLVLLYPGASSCPTPSAASSRLISNTAT